MDLNAVKKQNNAGGRVARLCEPLDGRISRQLAARTETEFAESRIGRGHVALAGVLPHRGPHYSGDLLSSLTASTMAEALCWQSTWVTLFTFYLMMRLAGSQLHLTVSKAGLLRRVEPLPASCLTSTRR